MLHNSVPEHSQSLLTKLSQTILADATHPIPDDLAKYICSFLNVLIPQHILSGIENSNFPLFIILFIFSTNPKQFTSNTVDFFSIAVQPCGRCIFTSQGEQNICLTWFRWIIQTKLA